MSVGGGQTRFDLMRRSRERTIPLAYCIYGTFTRAPIVNNFVQIRWFETQEKCEVYWSSIQHNHEELAHKSPQYTYGWYLYRLPPDETCQAVLAQRLEGEE